MGLPHRARATRPELARLRHGRPCKHSCPSSAASPSGGRDRAGKSRRLAGHPAGFPRRKPPSWAGAAPHAPDLHAAFSVSPPVQRGWHRSQGSRPALLPQQDPSTWHQGQAWQAPNLGWPCLSSVQEVEGPSPARTAPHEDAQGAGEVRGRACGDLVGLTPPSPESARGKPGWHSGPTGPRTHGASAYGAPLQFPGVGLQGDPIRRRGSGDLA